MKIYNFFLNTFENKSSKQMRMSMSENEKNEISFFIKNNRSYDRFKR